MSGKSGIDGSDLSGMELNSDAEDKSKEIKTVTTTPNGGSCVKVVIIGDSATGKSKLLERFLLDKYKPLQASTFALNLYRYETTVETENVSVDFWDTAGQERFRLLHPSFYHMADACVMVFDATRKITYKNLPDWYDQLRRYRPTIPCFCAANKIDENMEITTRTFAFAEKNNIPMYYVSAATGSNVVTLFRDAITAGLAYRKNPTNLCDQILQELEKSMTEPEANADTNSKGDGASKKVEG